MRFGDYIIEINGESTESLNHSDAMMIIKTTGVSLRLTLSKYVMCMCVDVCVCVWGGVMLWVGGWWLWCTCKDLVHVPVFHRNGH